MTFRGLQDFVSVIVLRLGVKGLGINTYQREEHFLLLFPSLVWAVWLQRSSFPPAGQISPSSPDSVIHHHNNIHQLPGTSKHISLSNKISNKADFQMPHCILDSENQVKIIN